MATSASETPETSCVVTTKNFFVRYISISGLHSGLSDHGRMSSEVQNATCASLIPKSLNISGATRFNRISGSPMAK